MSEFFLCSIEKLLEILVDKALAMLMKDWITELIKKISKH